MSAPHVPHYSQQHGSEDTKDQRAVGGRPYPYSSADTGFSTDSSTNDDPQGQRLQQTHPAQQASRYHVMQFWSWEIMSFWVAVGLLAATVSILAHYEGQKLPEWPFSINLNTLIALLSTILRAAMLVAVAEVLGQLKYGYFSRPRPLKHLHDFDRASRSVNGSIKLLFIAPKSLLAVIGAIVTILSLAIGPFTQQAIKSVSCPQYLRDTNASLPIAHFMPGRADYYRIGAGTWEVEVDMKGAMINGLTNPTGNDSAIVATCATGNCTFPVGSDDITHSSLGMCSACFDTTSFVSANENRTNYTMPNDLWLSPYSGQAYLNVQVDYNLSWASSEFPDGFATLANDALTNITVLTFTQSPCSNNSQGELVCPHNVTGYVGSSDYVATSCSIYPCLKNFQANMRRGVLDERVVSTVPAPVNRVEANITESGVSAAANYTALKSPCLIDGVEYDKSNFSRIPRTPGRIFTGINVDGTEYTAPDECLYKLMWLYGHALDAFMAQTLFSGMCTYDSRQGGSLYCGDAWWLSPLYNTQNASFETINSQIDQYATAVTNKFRTLGSNNYNLSSEESALGSVIEMTVCTSFDWRWLLMPAVLLVATGSLLVLMIVQNYMNPQQPVWKSSILPLLFHGFGQSPEMGAQPAVDLDHIKERAYHIKAKFQTGMNAGFVDTTGGRVPAARDIDLDSLLGNRDNVRR
ncbi:hypothetical protein JX265_011194 [Neoarthrinium moseri]|uniref:Uncharacterized protein n=1 Tax=Neoarthrinium moseri TaxID=1658444 RepID=A0A9Q0AJN8_9PEZI|nr:uncharacterized protein JN550_010498 [Neoarthrinium moseri]KAI1857459.1 hypothetical protein JX265_011194 [Neoarthrinium moseri]KAI1862033.1 hypothetical protein JN550_010498 [Neoarthrinium moseri]